MTLYHWKCLLVGWAIIGVWYLSEKWFVSQSLALRRRLEDIVFGVGTVLVLLVIMSVIAAILGAVVLDVWEWL